MILGTVFNNDPDNSIELEETCIDINNTPGVDHPLTINKWDGRLIEPLNGEVVTSLPSVQRYTDFKSPTPYTLRTHLATDMPSAAADATKLIARTNPSRVDVAPLSLIQDMFDLPKMLKEIGHLMKHPKLLRAHPGYAAHANIMLQFGWLPLVSDINKLLNIQSYIEQRSGELQRLYSKGGLKRRLNLGFSSAETTGITTLESSIGLTVYAKYSKFTSSRRWGTIRWLPTGLPPWTSKDGKYIEEARHLVSGFTINGLNAGAWDLLPWSFIVDYFTNSGEFMQANLNSIPAMHLPANIMTESTTVINLTRLGSGGDSIAISGGSGICSYVTKQRDIIPAGDLSSLPGFLSWRQLSNLASLYIQRYYKRRG
jgi:hypothetical protein